MKKKKSAAFTVLAMVFLYCGQNIYAQDTNTIQYDSSKGSPKATLANINWLQGRWKGYAFGGITEEVWTPPAGGSMMCAFKLIVNEKVRFYELVTIVEENTSLILRLKHFHADLKGWEEKDKTINFKLVKITGNRVYFDEFTFEKLSENEMNIYVAMQNNGKSEEVKFNYVKQ